MGKVDLVIRGGTVADGSGGALYEADIAVEGGRITAIGKIAETGRDEVDARGLLVTPGFVDLHSHYDGQLTWSDTLDPSSGHGVTTVVTGNCGVGFAPCAPDDREKVIRLMEGVEDIPELVMAAGLPWDWESFPEYMDSIESRPHDIDFAALLPHAAVRVAVMGERAVSLEPSTEADCARMRQIAHEAMKAGAAGFSTSRSIFHKGSDGKSTPTFSAEDREIGEILKGLTDAGRGVVQAIVMSKELSLGDFERIHGLATTAGRPISCTMLQVPWNLDLWREVADSIERDNAAGADIKMQVFNRPVGVILGLEASFHPFAAHPYYLDELANFPLAQRVERMRDPAVRAILLQATQLLDHPLSFNMNDFDKMYAMDEVANYEPDPSTSMTELARARGISPYEIAYDALMRFNGMGKLLVASTSYSEGNLDGALKLMKEKNSILALGDGGAHYGLICDASYPTTLLTHWVRDRRGERIELPQAIRMLTDLPASFQRFRDRGRLAPGMKADINIIDTDKLKLYSPHVVHDLPSGGRRLTQRADGYVATYVAGAQIRRNGEDTGARPGRLVRNAGI